MPLSDILSKRGLDFSDDFLSHSVNNAIKGPGTFKPEDWNSIIGIVTAIVGNVLISFALNTQRYAHIRLARDAKIKGRAKSTAGTTNSLDAEDPSATKLAKQKSSNSRKPNTVSHQSNATEDDARETDPLLPKSPNGPSVASVSSSDGGDDEDDNDEKGDAAQTRKNYLKSPIWWIGIVLMVVGEAGNFLAYGFAPASIVSPLGVVALISNCLIAPIMLKEKFRSQDLFGVIIAVAGAVTVVLSAKDSNPKLGPGQILKFVSRWEFLTYLGITLSLILLLMLASNRFGHRTILVDLGLVGLFGGYTALSTKGVASLFSSKLFDIFSFPITYLLVLVLVVTAVMQIKYVNRALQRFDSTQVIPTQFVMFTIFVVLGSAILYRDFEKTDAANVGKFIAGVALTFLGVWCITSGRTPESNQDDYDGDVEQGIDLVDEEAPTTPTLKPTQSAPGSSTEYMDSPASFATATSRIPASPTKTPKQPSWATSQAARSTPNLSRKKTPTAAEHRATGRTDKRLQIPQTPTQQKADPRPFSPSHTNSDTTVTQISSQFNTPANAYSTPQPSSSIPRHVLNRHSIAGNLTPGPYLSPLSSGLSVVVADSLRRRGSTGQRPRVRARSLRQPPIDQGRGSSLPDPNLDGADVAAAMGAGRAASGSYDGSSRPSLGERGATVEVASAAMERRAESDDWDDGLLPTQSNRATF